MKKQRAPIQDPHASFTHSCNNLASYEVKKNSKPSKTNTLGVDLPGSTSRSIVVQKPDFSKKQDHSTTLEGLKSFTKPNLDEGNRFFEDNRELFSKFGHPEPAKVNNFSRKQERQVPKFVPVTHEAPFGSRSYITLGYTPKKYNVRPRTAVTKKYQQIRKDHNEKDLVESTVRKNSPKKVRTYSPAQKQDASQNVVEFQITSKVEANNEEV